MTTSQVPFKAPKDPVTWVRRNLFRSPIDGLISIIFGGLSLYGIFRLVNYIFVTGRWEIIEVNLRRLLYGDWPAEELARLGVALVAITAIGGFIAGMVHARQVRAGTSASLDMSLQARALDTLRRLGPVISAIILLLLLANTVGPWILVGVIVVAAIAGRFLGGLVGGLELPGKANTALFIALAAVIPVLFIYLTAAVPFGEWEGFLLNMVLAAGGIVLCFPLGVLLALGRRSKLKLVSAMSTTYIEIFRGSPLFVLLLLANVSLQFFIPGDLPSKPTRALIVFTLFTAAYLAEIIRGGLQSVPGGQAEAAKALGLSPIRETGYIVLPQALRNVIPAQVGQFISLFKDTTLAGLAMSLSDVLTTAEAITQQDDFRGQGLAPETIAFVCLLLWIGSFTMSRESQRLEKKLGVGVR